LRVSLQQCSARRVIVLLRACRVTEVGDHRSAHPTQGAPGALLGLKSCCSFWYALRYANRSHLRSTSWKNRAIVRLESVQEQAQPAKLSRSTSITTTRCCSSNARFPGRHYARS